MYRQMSESEVNRIVGQIDATRADLFSMDHVDRPQAKAFTGRVKQDPRITRAKTRARTAAWRKRNAELKRATSQELCMAMWKALATSTRKDLTHTDMNLVGRAFADLQLRGFDIREAKSYLHRLRDSVVDPADRSEGVMESVI